MPCFLVGHLTAPPHSILCVCSGSMVAIFEVAGRLLSVFLPMVPAFRSYVGSKFAFHEERIAIVAPRASEKYLVDAFVGSEPTGMEDIAVGLVGWCGGGSDV